MKHLKYSLIVVLSLLIGLAGCDSNKSEKSGKVEDKQIVDPVLAELDAINQKITADTLNADLYEERAEFYYKNKQINEALKDIRKALSIDSSYSNYYVTLSDIYLEMGKLKNSIIALDRAVELDSKNQDAWLRLAEMSIVFNEYHKALGYIDKAMKIDDMNPKPYFLRGQVMLETGDTIHAITNFQKTIEVDQDFFDAQYQLGLLYLGKKNSLAVDYFNNALNIDPNSIEAKYYLGIYYQETGDYEKAINIYQSILEKNPDYVFATYNIGFINLVYLENYDEAIEFFTKAIGQHPDYIDAIYNRGLSYEMKKDAMSSKRDYEKVLELRPNYQKAVDGLNRVDEYLSGR